MTPPVVEVIEKDLRARQPLAGASRARHHLELLGSFAADQHEITD